ncbi:MAG: response regulator [Patescibacteria group bacterium]
MAEDNKKKILVVEDDEFLRSLTVKRLSEENYEVITAVDGNSGLSTAVDEKPDLVLLDLLLPGMSGFEVLEKMKADDQAKDIPVVVFSNLGQREDIEKAKTLGANDYLIKANFTLDDVVEKVDNYLNK